MTLVTDKQMAAIRSLAQRGMVTTVEIYRRDAVTPAPSDDYGDNVEYNETSASRRSTVKGWLYTTPATMPDLDSGAAVTPQLWALRVPVGTQIATGDRVVIAGNDYHVAAVDGDKTYAPYVTCNLRRRLG